MTGLSIIMAFAFVQCVTTMNNNEQFANETIMQGVVDTSFVMKYYDKMGIDNSAYLNDYEAGYFNEIFKDRGSDFTGKKVFFFGPGGLVFSNKQKFFRNLKENNYVVHSDLYIFDESEKEESGGYDIVIVYWSKRNYLSKDLVKRIKEK